MWETGAELWRTDGTKQGTKLVKDIMEGNAGSLPWTFTRFRKHLYFAAYVSGQGVELWRTNGKAAGTKLVKQTVPGADGHVGCTPSA